MTRRVYLYLVGSLVLVSLAGCGRGYFTAEREAWRAEAEAACLKSGTVKENASLVRISPISGPGTCGAEYPLKVAALGGNSAMGYSGELRPPGGIPVRSNQPRWPINGSQPQSYPQQTYPAQQAYPSQGPVSLQAPGSEAPVDDDTHVRNVEQLYQDSPRLGAPATSAPNYAGPAGLYRQRDAYPAAAPRLGPSRGDPVGTIGPVTFKPAATLACPLVSALDRWIMEAIQPAAMKWFGQPVAEIRQISAYSCRGMNGNPNARISEHAYGNALDIAAFMLADGRRISVKDGWKGLPEEQGFLRDVQGAACGMFTTVLAPGSNIYHYDHIHVDLMRRSKGRAICNPAAVSGEAIAARASGRYAGRDMGVIGSGVTGSIGGKRRPSTKRGSDDDWVEDESNIRDTGR